MRLIPVPVTELGHWADAVRPFMQEFAADGALTADDYLASVERQERQLWVAADEEIAAVLLTSVLADRCRTVLVTQCAGTGRADWVHFWHQIEAWARDIGSQRIEVTCRPGWKRDLQGMGLRQTHVVMEKSLV